jgi:two-component system phosphate regulon sensor histidine kinase PhoR
VLASASDITLPGTPPREAPSDSDVQPRIGRILALTDITEIARTIQMKTDFAANASHELRTPLSAIRGAIETLLNIDLSDDAESATRFLGVIDRHNARLEALVEDLLALSRLESPVSEFKPMTVDWHRFRDELIAKWTDAVEKKQLHWEWVTPPDLREVGTNPQLIRLVLDNLVDNAIKFTAAGGHITVASRREGNDLVVEVADDGCGIPAEDQERVFERFYQVATARSGTGSEQPETRGTGLGLSIVRHAVAAMKGTVTLTSEPGVGTRVTTTIPQPGRE